MDILILAGAVVILLFCGVIAFGAPFLPTLKKRVDDALHLLDLKPGETLLELGSGDGRLLKAAGKKHIKAIGYELNPVLVLYSKIYTWPERKYVSIKWGNYWRAKWPPSDGMYVFLLQPYMSKLHKKVAQYSKGNNYKLVSFAFEIKGKKPTKTKDGMFLYEYN